MIQTNSYAVFRADFPDDSEEVGDEVAVPAGRNVVDAICERLRSAGMPTTQPTQHSFYGWTAEFQLDNATIWMLLQSGDPERLLIVEARCSWLSRAATKAEALAHGVALIKEILGSDSRFSGVQWMSQQEFESAKRHRR